ncbi:hypothetical protein POTOM_006972 [Populus tomentosa]|uniref:Uncharacterized protein n=1 Tax=Populus tomentosa TaxID=118781 RepID=A0A8X8DG33_POPTO|nr:hypothetical protein POTOM_006972 [Populus tomentosa]
MRDQSPKEGCKFEQAAAAKCSNQELVALVDREYLPGDGFYGERFSLYSLKTGFCLCCCPEKDTLRQDQWTSTPCNVTTIYFRIAVDACRDRESNFDVASSRNLAQELVFHTQRASGSFQAFANSLLIINYFNSFGQILQPSAAIRSWLRSLPVAKPRQAAAFELTVLHGTAASFMLARQKRKESRKSMEKKRFFMAMSSTPV